MKIYNFAMEVYDALGSRIGRWRSCGQQQWELISHEVISQLLFSTAHSLNSRYTNLFFLAPRMMFLVRGAALGCVKFASKKVEDAAGFFCLFFFLRRSFSLRECQCDILHLCCYMWLKMVSISYCWMMMVTLLLLNGITLTKSLGGSGECV